MENGFTQNDSDKIKVGPEEIMSAKGNYHNFADKNKVNIEIVVLGSVPGRYLIPQGTSLFEFLLMAGGTSSYLVDDIKIVRFRSETPNLKGSEVMEYNFTDLYSDDKRDILRSQKNPVLRPGDMIVLPEPKVAEQTIFYYIRETIYFIGTLVSFYYLIDNVIRRSQN